MNRTFLTLLCLALLTAVYVLLCANAGFHPTLSIVDVTESHK